NQDLQIVSVDLPEYASLKVEGNNSAIRNLKASDITVYVQYSAVKGPGEYELPLDWKKATSANYEGLELLPKTVTIQFEKIVEKSLSLTVSAPNIEAEEGYFIDKPTSTTTMVSVSGPETEVNRVVSAVAIDSTTEVRNSTKYISGVPVMLLDENGVEVESDLITITPSKVEIGVLVLEQREVPVEVTFIGMPTNFDETWFRSLMTLSEDALRVAGQSANLNSFSVYSAGVIDLTAFSLTTSYPAFNVQLPKDIKSQDGVQQILATFDTSGLATRTFDVSNIQVINQPAGLSIQAVESQVHGVTLVGPSDLIDTILPDNIVVQVDAMGITATQGGQQSIGARILISRYNRIFAIGTYNVVCNVTVN
ncbi:MAG: YbbR-like domain-containing protein, partial [Oscillospiraceae bacterium]